LSYSLMPYYVDLQVLRAAVGGKDEALLAALAAARPELFAEEADPDEDEVALGTAVRHLVMGDPPAGGSAHQYGYALKELCEHLGEPAESDCWEAIRWDVIAATGMDEILTRTGPPVPLPPNDDFPRIGHLSAEEARTQAARFDAGPVQTLAPSGRKSRRGFREWLLDRLLRGLTRRDPLTADDLRELLDEYAGWLRKAAAEGKGLVFFYY
jgi:hypothetical protein